MTTVRLPLISTKSAAEDLGEASDARVHATLQVGDLARESGKTVRAIHLYEELDLLRPAGRSKGRYRLYGPEALARIRWIGKLQDMGFSLTEIQAIVRDWEQSSSAPRAMVHVRDIFTKKLADTREHLRRLEALKSELEASLVYLDTCEVCDPERLLTACKACDLHTCNDGVPELVAGFHAHSHQRCDHGAKPAAPSSTDGDLH